MRVYRLPASVRDVLTLLPALAGVARNLRGMGETSSNGVPGGTLLANGYVQYTGSVLGLPFDVFATPGAPVYGPLYPPPGMPVMQPSPYSGTFNTQAPITTFSTVTTPPTANTNNYNPGPNDGLIPVVLPALPAGGDLGGDPVDNAETIGKETGDTFRFEDLLQRAEELAPWYVWAAGGAGLLLIVAGLHHHKQQKRRGRQ